MTGNSTVCKTVGCLTLLGSNPRTSTKFMAGQMKQRHDDICMFCRITSSKLKVDPSALPPYF